jgi:uncharacterized protein YeaO (DUF488 family)
MGQSQFCGNRIIQEQRERSLMLQVKRVYDTPSSEEGYRVLVDRLWPRGLKREAALVHSWLKEIAPSDELRRWFGHDPERWKEFQARYGKELAAQEPLWRELLQRARKGRVTLLYSAKDTQHNNAVALKSFLDSKAGQ